MLSCETQQRTYAKLQQWIALKDWTQVDHVLIPDEAGNYREEHQAPMIFSTLLKQGSTEFNCASRSPFTQHPIRDDLPLWQTSQCMKDILEGRYEPPGEAPEMVKYLLDFMKRPYPPANPIEGHISLEEFHR